jgi:hypothetical protein
VCVCGKVCTSRMCVCGVSELHCICWCAERLVAIRGLGLGISSVRADRIAASLFASALCLSFRTQPLVSTIYKSEYSSKNR